MMTRSSSISASLLSILFFSFFSKAVNPGCRCIRFTNSFEKDWGVFTSPDYPHSYPTGIGCLLYSFQAPKDYIVQVFLENIHLPKPSRGCYVGDYLKFFLHLNEEGVNERTPWNSLLCGQATNQSFYSASRHLIIQFHSAPHRVHEPHGTSSNLSTQLGFSGRFRFLNASQFESSGRVVPGTKCDYQFVSANYTAAQGKFFSPYYPSTYPHNIKCAYHFHASSQERVKIVFDMVALQTGQYSCLNKTDVIRVMDGSSSRSPVITLICNTLTEYEVISTGSYMLIEFISNSDQPGNGFRARFHFIKIVKEDNFDPLRFNLANHKYSLPNTELLQYGEDGLPLASTLVPQCNQVIFSDGGRNGSISSPNYPHPYPAKSHCRYEFVGHGRERVHIHFVDFDLYQADPKTAYEDNKGGVKDSEGSSGGDTDEKMETKCKNADSLSAYVHVDGIERRIVKTCGPHTPPEIMSNGHKMTVEFTAVMSAANTKRGFYAQYSYVEDLGIKSGEQLLDYPCAFVYNRSTSTTGNFTSPNYPGLYPRSTECHYFFYGDNKDRVILHFINFQLGADLSCDEESDGDYMEFSNYMPIDRSFNRKCGYDPGGFTVTSSRKFFRVTFRSGSANNRYDATGFFATFQFTDKINQPTIINVRSSTSLCIPWTFIILLFVRAPFQIVF